VVWCGGRGRRDGEGNGDGAEWMSKWAGVGILGGEG
jgi:hypothetical protein